MAQRTDTKNNQASETPAQLRKTCSCFGEIKAELFKFRKQGVVMPSKQMFHKKLLKKLKVKIQKLKAQITLK